MQFLQKKPVLVLFTQYSEVNEKFEALYSKEFNIRVAKTLIELNKMRSKLKNIRAIFYDAITLEHEEAEDFINNFTHGSSEYFGVILADLKLKGNDDYIYLDNLYKQLESGDIDAVVNLKRDDSYPSVSSMLGSSFDDEVIEKEKYEDYFKKVYGARIQIEEAESKEVSHPMSNASGIPVIPRSMVQDSKTNIEESHSQGGELSQQTSSSLSDAFGLPTGDELQKVFTRQQNTVPKSDLAGQTVESASYSAQYIQERSDSNLLTHQQQESLLKEVEDLRNYSKNTYQDALKIQENNKQLSKKNDELELQLNHASAGAVAIRMNDFISGLEKQQKELKEIKDNIDQNAINEIEELQKVNEANLQQITELRQKWRDERTKVKDLESLNGKLDKTIHDLNLDLDITKEELEDKRAMIEQFQAFQSQFANIFNSNSSNQASSSPSKVSKAKNNNHAQKPKTEQKSSTLVEQVSPFNQVTGDNSTT